MERSEYLGVPEYPAVQWKTGERAAVGWVLFKGEETKRVGVAKAVWVVGLST